ncbi:MAG: MoaD/ThiS family protein [Clostridiales Family XIII bacterium]|jgi:molybdopterin converting factor small subunit|nr:MoaD/ThiS family protein [Clostridiales Family XIII bacterium]
MANILIPTALRAFTDGNAQVDVSGQTAGEAIEALAANFPDIRQHLYDGDGKLRSYVNVYIGDENIRDLGGLAAPVAENGVLSLVPAIAGGCQ